MSGQPNIRLLLADVHRKELLIRDEDAPHVARKAWTVKFDAKVVASFTDAHMTDAVKIVDISDDLELAAACERAAQTALGEKSSRQRPQEGIR